MLLRTLKRMLSIGAAFIVFGIIDNGVMIIAGSAIDHKLGEIFKISTMASAGLGNTFSDIIGICCGRYIEKIVHRILPKEEDLPHFKVIFAEAVGITCGCLLGMLPLYFIKN